MQTQTFFPVLLVLVMIVPTGLYAQQEEIPPVNDEQALALIEPSAGSGRIVEGRPWLYSFKRVAHPITWIESAIHPMLRLTEKASKSRIGDAEKKTPSTAGVKFFVGGLGPSTGFGPAVKPYHRDLLGMGIEAELPLVVTYRMYQSYQLRLSRSFHPWLVDSVFPMLKVDLNAGYFARPSDSFYGIGNETPRTETRYRTATRSAGIGAESNIYGAWTLRGSMGVRSVGVAGNGDFLSTLDMFSPSEIPELDKGTVMLQTGMALKRNTTDQPHFASSGGIQVIEASLNEGYRGGDFSYWRYHAKAQQFFPLSRDHRKVLSFRAEMETNRPKGGSHVPFFDLPTVGSFSTLRGYMTRRFSDRSAMNTSMEYRYRVWRYFDMSLFTDVGQVAPDIGGFSWDNLHTSYGTGFIVRSEAGRGIITNVTRSREGWGFYVNFSPLF
jgi:hypothetical protein